MMRGFFSSIYLRAISRKKGEYSHHPGSWWGPGSSLSPTACPGAAPRTKSSVALCFPAPLLINLPHPQMEE